MSHQFEDLDATERAGIEAALNRCRALAAQIASELRNKRPEHFVDKLSLADFYASLEHAADVLAPIADSRSRIHLLPWRRVRGRGTGSDNLGRSSPPHALAGLVRTFREQKRQTQDTTEALPSMRHSPTALPQTVRH
jgi:hypothetical protein